MKALGAWVGASMFALAVLVGLACTKTQGQEVKTVVTTVLTDTQKACIVVNAVFPDPVVQTLCAIDNSLVPFMQQLAAAQRASMARWGAAQHCGP